MPKPSDKLLLIEDDDRIRSLLVLALADLQVAVDSCGTLEEARSSRFEDYSLILLDLGLPDGSGLELCRELRAVGDQTPLIVLTARGAPDERVLGLEAGADDYITKPFHLPELMARIDAVLRRAPGRAVTERLSCGELWLDPITRQVGREETPIELKRREFDLLQFLMRNSGRAWTRAQLLARVWESNFIGEERTVDLHIGRLRAQVEEDASEPRLIQTVWGVGYRMAEEA
jgi:DNA-binding response OmpR family regulator